jgi:hypothetical protein
MSERSPKLVPNGLTLVEYGRLHYIDRAIAEYGSALVVEVFNSLGPKKAATKKLAHAHDAAEFFGLRSKKNLLPVVIHKTGNPHKKIIQIPKFNRNMLEAMFETRPRLSETTLQLPYNTDYYQPQIQGIPPFEQQITYHVLRASLDAKTSPEEVFNQGSKKFKLPEYVTKTALWNARGAFFEMYIGTCLMECSKHPYQFFSRVCFPLWNDAHLNGKPLDGEEIESGKKRIRAEIDSILAIKNPEENLECLVEIHKSKTI